MAGIFTIENDEVNGIFLTTSIESCVFESKWFPSSGPSATLCFASSVPLSHSRERVSVKSGESSKYAVLENLLLLTKEGVRDYPILRARPPIFSHAEELTGRCRDNLQDGTLWHTVHLHIESVVSG